MFLRYSSCPKNESIDSFDRKKPIPNHTYHKEKSGFPFGVYRMHLPIAFYIPNVLGYVRIMLALWGLSVSSSQPMVAVSFWIVSASLDLFDGILARALNQTSSLGVLLDIAADNILRAAMWIAAGSVSSSDQLSVIACLIISLEWITMLATQLHAAQSGTHWKATRDKDPWWIQSIFSNNFRNPLGTWCIFGLFSASLFAYADHQKELMGWIPFFGFWKYLAYSGRLLSMFVEVWLILGYLALVNERDSKSARNKMT